MLGEKMSKKKISELQEEYREVLRELAYEAERFERKLGKTAGKLRKLVSKTDFRCEWEKIAETLDSFAAELGDLALLLEVFFDAVADPFPKKDVIEGLREVEKWCKK